MHTFGKAYQTVKMGQVLCQLYLNKVVLKKKQLCLSILSHAFSFAGGCTCRESEWEFTDSLETGVILKHSKFSINTSHQIILDAGISRL